MSDTTDAEPRLNVIQPLCERVSHACGAVPRRGRPMASTPSTIDAPAHPRLTAPDGSATTQFHHASAPSV